MNKKSLRYFVPCLAMALCSVAFTSCSDDDEGSVPTGPTTTFDGKQLVAVGNYTFRYDDRNRCDGVSYYNDDFIDINYDNSTIYLDDDFDELGGYKVKFNGKGYISNISASWNFSEGSDRYNGSGSISFSYNGDRLVSQEMNSKEEYAYEGERYSYSATGKTTLEWRNGDLVSGSMRYEESEDDYESWMADEFTVTYDETLANPHKQFPYVLYSLLDEDYYVFGLVGMVGVGPEHLPASYEGEFSEEGQPWSESYSGNVGYGLNEDGTIDWERLNGSTYRYDYYTAGGNDVYGRSASKMSSIERSKKVRDMFMKYRNRK